MLLPLQGQRRLHALSAFVAQEKFPPPLLLNPTPSPAA
jgi:hypothetical protein